MSLGLLSAFSFFLFLSFTLYTQAINLESVDIVANEYIVAFHEYTPQDTHADVIASIIGNTQFWHIIDRSNKASEHPSDFALIEIAPGHETKILLQLRNSPVVKYVTQQKRYTGDLKDFIADESMGNIVPPRYSFRSDSKNNTCTGQMKHNPFIYNVGRNSAKIPSNDQYADFKQRNLLADERVTHELNADFFWAKGFTGEGVKVAIFDTGLPTTHSHFLHVEERTDWTDENTLEDYVGHGTFVAGIIASTDLYCSGFAPDASLYVFRVFTNSRVSYTSWFLDAFNYAIHTKVDVLNLSIGGPDWMDQPFVEKVWELSANNILVVSAIGNDGPLYGTLNNPADMPDVLGVGGINYQDKIATFSSRGMTTWELPTGYGRSKPDVVAYGQSVSGSRLYEGCRMLSGTSVASPVVTGAVTLLLSAVPEYRRKTTMNPASLKQILMETSELVVGANIFEQGAGRINLVAAYEALALYTPRASVFPSSLDLTECPYMWPYCSQPLYYTGMPTIVNTTILNGMGVVGKVASVRWEAGSLNGRLLDVAFSHSDILWPWTGYLALHIRVNQDGEAFNGLAEGNVVVTIESPSATRRQGEGVQRSEITVPVRVKIVARPEREKRILWDQYHSLQYPLGFLPHDILWDKANPFDWHADHPHTNFRGFYQTARNLGYYVEVLGEGFKCFDASLYGTLVIADPEDEFSEDDVDFLKRLVDDGLSVLLLADWYNSQLIQSVTFFDENTNKWWTPFTGGANIPAVNRLLAPYGIKFSNKAYSGEFTLAGQKAMYGSGSSILEFPESGYIVTHKFLDQTQQILNSKTIHTEIAFLGLYSTASDTVSRGGRIAVIGDSSCFDDQQTELSALWLLADLLKYTSSGSVSSTILQSSFTVDDRLYDIDQIKAMTPHPPEDSLPLDTISRVNHTECKVSDYFNHVQEANNNEPTIDVIWQPLVYIQQERQNRNHATNNDAHFIQDYWNYLLPNLVVLSFVIMLIAFCAIRRKNQTPLSGDVNKNSSSV